jgi:hypothetical protein
MSSMIPPFTAAQAALLQDFLASPQRPAGTLTYAQSAGFLFSLANGPEPIPPSEWIPMVFDDHDAGYDTHAEAAQSLPHPSVESTFIHMSPPQSARPQPPAATPSSPSDRRAGA